MKIYRAYQFRIYPTKEQALLINQTIGSVRYVYNYFLKRKDDYYQENKSNLSLKEIKHELVELKKENEWLNDVDSMALTNSLEDLDTAFKNFFSKRSVHPKYKMKGKHERYKTDCITSVYKNNHYANIDLDLDNRILKLPKLGFVKIRGYRNLRKELNIKNATIIKNAKGYYVSLCVEEEIEKEEFHFYRAIGIDVGVANLVVGSDGMKYSKLKINRIEEHIKRYQEKLSRCVKKSKNYYKIKNKISRLYQKIKNMRKFYIHKITNELVKENDLIACENLKTKEMIMNSKRKSLTKGIVNASFREIIQQLEYKTKWKNKLLIKIGTYYPSSKLCSHCGYKNNINDLSIRAFECSNCHNYNDRDINASINILWEGLRIAFKEGKIMI